MPSGPRLVSVTTEWTPPPRSSLWSRILAIFGIGGTVANQPPTGVTAAYDQESYEPGEEMTVVLKGTGQNVTLKSFTGTFVLEDATVNPAVETTVTASSSVQTPNTLSASAQEDTMGRTYTPGEPTQTGQSFETTFTATA